MAKKILRNRKRSHVLQIVEKETLAVIKSTPTYKLFRTPLQKKTESLKIP